MDLDLETFFLNSTQLQAFLISCVVGLLFGLIYDVFRVFRIVIPHNSILVAIEDIILLTAYGIFTICFAFSIMRGQIRFFFLVGNFIGFILWYLTIGSVIIKTALRLKGYILKVIDLILTPIKKISTLLVKVKKKLKNTQKNT